MAAHNSVLLVWPDGASGDGAGGASADPPSSTSSSPAAGPCVRQSVLGAHTGRVNAVAFRPACEGGGGGGAAAAAAATTRGGPQPLLVASAGADRCVRLWDARTRRCVRSASKLKAEPVAVAWVGGTGGGPPALALGCADGSLLAWKEPMGVGGPPPAAGPPPPRKPTPVPGWTPDRGGITCLAAEPAGGDDATAPRRLAVGCGDGSVWVVGLGGGGPPPPPPARLWTHAAAVQGLAWAGMGGNAPALASGGADGRVLVREVDGAAGPPAALTPGGAAAAEPAAARRRWTTLAWVAVPAQPPCPPSWWLVAGAGPGGELAAWPAGAVLPPSATPPPPPSALPAAHSRIVFALAAASGSGRLASTGMDRTVRLWRVGPAAGGGAAAAAAPAPPAPLPPPFRPGPSLPGLGGCAHALALRVDGPSTTAAVACGDGTVRLWPVAAAGGAPPPGSAAPLWRGLPPQATAAAWGGVASAPALAVGGSDGSVGLLNPAAGTCVRLDGGGGGGGKGPPTSPPVVALAWLPSPSSSSPPSAAAWPDLLSLHADGAVLRWGGDALAAAAVAAAGAKAGGRGRAGAGGGAPLPPTTPARPADFLAEASGGGAIPWAGTAVGDTPSCMAVCAWQGGGGAATVTTVALGGAAGGVFALECAGRGASSSSWSRPVPARPHGRAVTAVAWREGGGAATAAGRRPWLASVGEDGVLAAHLPPGEGATTTTATAAALLVGDARPLSAVAWVSGEHTAHLTLAAGRADGTLLVARVVPTAGGGGEGKVEASSTSPLFSIAPLRSLSRHGGRVRGLAWLGPAALLSAADDQSVRLWEAGAGRGDDDEEEAVEAATAALPPPPTLPPPPPRRPPGPAAAAAAAFAMGAAPLVPAPAAGSTATTATGSPAGRTSLTAAAEGEDAAAVVAAAAADPAALALHTRRAAAARLWAGDEAGAVRTLLAAASAGGPAPPLPLDAHAVALAASAGRGAWVAAARAYAAALAASGEAGAAATYLIAVGDAPAAVRALARGGRGADAAALAAARLPEGHPARVALVGKGGGSPHQQAERRAEGGEGRR